uniref:NXPE family member 4-like isoform X1 n=2 Tax=Styela clava TaxID=7725 RepID=UPI00193A35EF|nr:NXPE family member 4-like isoform X1 [Styela clava]XP_039250876.1 NXPE family member 4-like isoform X1 [Styela clava]
MNKEQLVRLLLPLNALVIIIFVYINLDMNMGHSEELVNDNYMHFETMLSAKDIKSVGDIEPLEKKKSKKNYEKNKFSDPLKHLKTDSSKNHMKSRPRESLMSQIKSKSGESIVNDTDVPGIRIDAKLSETKTEKKSNEVKHHVPRLSDEDFNKFKKLHVRSGEWIRLFPHILKSIKSIEALDHFPTFEETTSADHSMVTCRQSEIKVGKTVKLHIQARDYNNKAKHYGGDYFRVFLQRPSFKGDGVSCTITDNTDGTYEAECPLLWTGKARVTVTMVNPSEVAYISMVRTNAYSEAFLTMNTSFINSKGETEYAICDMDLSDRFKKSEICDHSHPKTGEPWFCAKPPSGECNPIAYQGHRKFEKNIFPGDRYFNRKLNSEKVIGKSGFTISIAKITTTLNDDEFTSHVPNQLPCSYTKEDLHVPLDPAEATGYIHQGKWKSLECNNTVTDQIWTTCLNRSAIHVMGDSTILAFYRAIVNKLHGRHGVDKNISWAEPQKGFSNLTDTIFHFTSHGHPFHAEGPPEARMYIYDALDKIVDVGRPTYVVFGLGVHFGRLHPDIYLRRLKYIKISVSRLRKRVPGIKIFILGLHSNWPWIFQPCFVPYRHEVLLRNEFRKSEDVTFVPFWDMLEILGNKAPHPAGRIINRELELLFSYMCKN